MLSIPKACLSANGEALGCFRRLDDAVEMGLEQPWIRHLDLTLNVLVLSSVWEPGNIFQMSQTCQKSLSPKLSRFGTNIEVSSALSRTAPQAFRLI